MNQERLSMISRLKARGRSVVLHQRFRPSTRLIQSYTTVVRTFSLKMSFKKLFYHPIAVLWRFLCIDPLPSPKNAKRTFPNSFGKESG
jgi:hypothetical protein